MSQSKFVKSFPISITTSNGQEPNLPDIEIKNPLDAITYLNALELLLDPSFQLKGMMHITVNEADVFRSVNVGDLTRYGLFSIPLNVRRLDRQGKLKIFAWNGLNDGSPIFASGACIISDQEGDLSKGSLPATQPLNSPPVVLFPFTSYGNLSTTTQNFDMLGYKKMLVTIAATGYVTPILVQRTLGDWTIASGTSLDFDVDLTTLENIVSSKAAGNSFIEILDFSTNISRQLAFKWSQSQGASQNGTLTIFVSQDNIVYTQVFTQTWNNQVIAANTFTDITRTWRYVKFVVTDNSGANRANVDIYEVYDFLQFGGTANLSFEVFDVASQQWINLIPASEIGTISNKLAVSKQIGDVISRSGVTNVGYILPSNYALFRGRLDILGGNGGLFTGVTVIRVA